MQLAYSTSATASGGRDGRAATTDGILDVKLSTPKELGGPGGAATNPEQLFAAGYAACFLSAVKFVARAAKVAVPEGAAVTATVGIGANPKGQGFALDVGLSVSLPGLAQADAQSLVEQAHQVCPYSNATRGNVDVRVSLA